MNTVVLSSFCVRLAKHPVSYKFESLLTEMTPAQHLHSTVYPIFLYRCRELPHSLICRLEKFSKDKTI